jgi:hypothetical protein
MRPLEVPPSLAARPFTVAEARAAGVSWKVLQGSRFCSPTHGVYAPTGTDVTLVGRVIAALTALPAPCLATGVTGLQLMGVDVGPTDPLRFVTTHPRQVRRQGVRVTRVSILPPIRGLSAAPEHCWLVAALELDLLQLVTAGDWLVRLKLTSPGAIAAYVGGSSSRGSAAARPALALIRPRVDSPRETWLRLCLILAGLPEPECNPTIQGVRRSGRVDLLFRGFRVIVEYEGEQHRTDARQWHKDIDRQEDFGGVGYLTVRVTKEHARQPRLVVRRVYEALCSRGYRGPEPLFDDRWISLFER